jgi:AraC-like DNA-binding protein
MEQLDISLRAAGATLLLAEIMLILRFARDVPAARFGAIMAAGLILVLAIDNPSAREMPPALRAAILVISMNSAIFIWWFARALLEDDFRLGPFEWGVAALWFALGAVNFADFARMEPLAFPPAAIFRTAMAAGIVAHIVYVAFAGRAGDLVESRRRTRVVLALSIAAIFLADVAIEAVSGYLATSHLLSAVEAAAFAAVIFGSFLWLARLDRAALSLERPPAGAVPAVPSLGPRQELLKRKLDAAMDEKIYLDPELSIGGLSARLGAPEHQLRNLINAAIGAKNFRAYLNTFRLEEVKRRLSNPVEARTPILTIALESGFASLSAFNRAFKEKTGATPSDWRKAALATDSRPNSPAETEKV